jgi:DNA-binding PadR family transcriptional regulator
MSRRAELLDFAVLGLLHETPMHGYELRKRLNTALGAFRALSYGSLYPCLRDLMTKGWIRESRTAASPRAAVPARGSSTS